MRGLLFLLASSLFLSSPALAAGEVADAASEQDARFEEAKKARKTELEGTWLNVDRSFANEDGLSLFYFKFIGGSFLHSYAGKLAEQGTFHLKDGVLSAEGIVTVGPGSENGAIVRWTSPYRIVNGVLEMQVDGKKQHFRKIRTEAYHGSVDSQNLGDIIQY